MELFVEQKLEIFEESNNKENNRDVRPLLELTQPDIRVIEDRHFFISGPQNVYLLNTGDSFAHKLSMDEIQELPVEIVYTGEQKPDYLDDEKNALEIIIKIIRKMNMMQTSQIYSFPLG